MEASVRELTVGKRVRPFEQRIIAAPPARALLDAAGDNPKNLIVVGNRGLGAEEGQMLGSVPGEVVAHAMCNVLVVQTTRHAEDLAALTPAMEMPPGGGVESARREETSEEQTPEGAGGPGRGRPLRSAPTREDRQHGARAHRDASDDREGFGRGAQRDPGEEHPP